MIQHDVVRREQAGQVRRALCEPLPRNQGGEVAVVGDPEQHLEERLALIERPHVRVEVCGPDAEGARPLDLRAYLGLDLAGVGVRGGFGFSRVEEAFGVEQSRHAVFRRHRPPAVELPLAGERQVEAEVCVRVGARVVGDFGEPGAGNHDAARSDQAGVESLLGRGVNRVGHAEVVGVDDEELRVRRVAEPLK